MYKSAEQWAEFYRRLHTQANKLTDPIVGRVARRFVEQVPCPLCGSSSFKARVLRDGFQYVDCLDCSFVYVNPQLTQQAIHEAYNDEDVRLFYFNQLLLPYVEKDQVAEFRKRLLELSELCSSEHRRLLDIGCAAGNFLFLAKEFGFMGEGLELNRLYTEYVRKHRDVVVHERLLGEMNYPISRFDVITLWDVLEHLPNPKEVLQGIARILAPGGIVAFTTINHSCINERLLKDRWRYYMPPDHLCSFTPDLIRTLFRKIGLEVVKIQHQYMFEVLAEQYFKSLTVTGSGNLGRLKKVVYVLINAVSQAVFNSLKSGDIITVYARKS